MVDSDDESADFAKFFGVKDDPYGDVMDGDAPSLDDAKVELAPVVDHKPRKSEEAVVIMNSPVKAPATAAPMGSGDKDMVLAEAPLPSNIDSRILQSKFLAIVL